MSRIGIVGLIVGLLVLAATACSGEDVTLDLEGPASVASDEDGYYVAELWGGTPVLGFVYWIPYVDLDGDNWPDTNERLDEDGVLYYSEVDRLGNADFGFWVNPEEFFGDRDLDVPDEMEVGIRAYLYWSDPVESQVTRRAKVKTKITAP